jgi:hypothetical protein
VESFYEIIIFVAFYIFLVEAVIIRCFSVERVRGIVLQQLVSERLKGSSKLGLFTKLEFLYREIK